MIRGQRHSGLNGGWRQIVALLTVAAWVFAVAICPEVPEAVAAATQSSIQGLQAGKQSGHSDRHASCQQAAHASAVLKFSKAIRAADAIASSTPTGVRVTQYVLAAPAGPVTRIARAIDEQPWTRGTRFAGFWPHAPPLTL